MDMRTTPNNRLPGAARSLSGEHRRIVVVGTTGSGKTTLAGQLAHKLGVPHVELDALHWEANWVEATDDLFRERAAQALRGDAWVVDGNYSQVRDMIWSRVDMIVWLDYSLPVMMWRLTRRTLWRLATREVLWSGNRETIRNVFFSKDSLFLWQLSTYRKRRRDYPALLARPEYSHLAFARLRSPRETRRWLTVLPM